VGTIIRTRASVAWLLLVALTFSSLALGVTQDSVNEYPVSSAAIVLTAVFKIRLVGFYFMELREAPRELRSVFEAYCLVLAVLLCAMYFSAS
jgi:heme/copper-type cytochrome/quinol oxidase subunit 4